MTAPATRVAAGKPLLDSKRQPAGKLCQEVVLTIGKRIAEERKRLGFTQAQFAKLTGVSFSSQRRYEDGRSAPDTDYLDALARIGVDYFYVLTGLDRGFSKEEATRPDIARLITGDTSPQPEMCVVKVAPGVEYAMPMADGLAFMRAISGAVEVQRRPYSQPDCYQVLRPAPLAELRMIHPDQLLPLTPTTTVPDQP